MKLIIKKYINDIIKLDANDCELDSMQFVADSKLELVVKSIVNASKTRKINLLINAKDGYDIEY